MSLLIIKLIIDILLLIVLCVWIIKITCPKKTDEDRNNYLNNALRYLLREVEYTPGIRNAIGEICYCISKTGGRYHDDVAKKLAETGLCPFIEKEAK